MMPVFKKINQLDMDILLVFISTRFHARIKEIFKPGHVNQKKNKTNNNRALEENSECMKGLLNITSKRALNKAIKSI